MKPSLLFVHLLSFSIAASAASTYDYTSDDSSPWDESIERYFDHEARATAGKIPATFPQAYSRMSFYTSADENASVIVELNFLERTPSTSPEQTFNQQMWQQYTTHGGTLQVALTETQNNSLLIAWTSVRLNASTELVFPLASFAPKLGPYHLALWGVFNNGNRVFTLQCSLHVLPDDEARGFARRDRYQDRIQTLQPKSKPASPFTSETPNWHDVVPASIYITSWDIVNNSIVNDDVTKFFQAVKLKGFNVVHPKAGKEIKVPFDVDIIYSFLKPARKCQVYVLYDVNYRSPGNNYHIHKEHGGLPPTVSQNLARSLPERTNSDIYRIDCVDCGDEKEGPPPSKLTARGSPDVLVYTSDGEDSTDDGPSDSSDDDHNGTQHSAKRGYFPPIMDPVQQHEDYLYYRKLWSEVSEEHLQDFLGLFKNWWNSLEQNERQQVAAVKAVLHFVKANDIYEDKNVDKLIDLAQGDLHHGATYLYYRKLWYELSEDHLQTFLAQCREWWNDLDDNEKAEVAKVEAVVQSPDYQNVEPKPKPKIDRRRVEDISADDAQHLINDYVQNLHPTKLEDPTQDMEMAKVILQNATSQPVADDEVVAIWMLMIDLLQEWNDRHPYSKKLEGLSKRADLQGAPISTSTPGDEFLAFDLDDLPHDPVERAQIINDYFNRLSRKYPDTNFEVRVYSIRYARDPSGGHSITMNNLPSPSSGIRARALASSRLDVRFELAALSSDQVKRDTTDELVTLFYNRFGPGTEYKIAVVPRRKGTRANTSRLNLNEEAKSLFLSLGQGRSLGTRGKYKDTWWTLDGQECKVKCNKDPHPVLGKSQKCKQKGKKQKCTIKFDGGNKCKAECKPSEATRPLQSVVRDLSPCFDDPHCKVSASGHVRSLETRKYKTEMKSDDGKCKLKCDKKVNPQSVFGPNIPQDCEMKRKKVECDFRTAEGVECELKCKEKTTGALESTFNRFITDLNARNDEVSRFVQARSMEALNKRKEKIVLCNAKCKFECNKSHGPAIPVLDPHALPGSQCMTKPNKLKCKTYLDGDVECKTKCKPKSTKSMDCLVQLLTDREYNPPKLNQRSAPRRGYLQEDIGAFNPMSQIPDSDRIEDWENWLDEIGQHDLAENIKHTVTSDETTTTDDEDPSISHSRRGDMPTTNDDSDKSNSTLTAWLQKMFQPASAHQNTTKQVQRALSNEDKDYLRKWFQTEVSNMFETYWAGLVKMPMHEGNTQAPAYVDILDRSKDHMNQLKDMQEQFEEALESVDSTSVKVKDARKAHVRRALSETAKNYIKAQFQQSMIDMYQGWMDDLEQLIIHDYQDPANSFKTDALDLGQRYIQMLKTVKDGFEQALEKGDLTSRAEPKTEGHGEFSKWFDDDDGPDEHPTN